MKLFIVCVTLALLASNVELKRPKKFNPIDMLQDKNILEDYPEVEIIGTWGSSDIPADGPIYAGEVVDPPVINEVDVEECVSYLFVILGFKQGDENVTAFGMWQTDDPLNYLDGTEVLPYTPPSFSPDDVYYIFNALYELEEDVKCVTIENADNTDAQDILSEVGVCGDPIAIVEVVIQLFLTADLQDVCADLE